MLNNAIHKNDVVLWRDFRYSVVSVRRNRADLISFYRTRKNGPIIGSSIQFNIPTEQLKIVVENPSACTVETIKKNKKQPSHKKIPKEQEQKIQSKTIETPCDHCPFAGQGMICWHLDGSCLLDDAKK